MRKPTRTQTHLIRRERSAYEGREMGFPREGTSDFDFDQLLATTEGMDQVCALIRKVLALKANEDAILGANPGRSRDDQSRKSFAKRARYRLPRMSA